MKQLTCDVCGGTNLIKQDGVFVCQTCGIKYSIDEIRNMLSENPVHVANTATIVTNDKLAKYYRLARTAKDEDDSETALKYYQLIREEDPESWEAKFYSVYFETMECTVADAYSMCIKFQKIAPSVLSAIKNGEPKDKQIEYVLQITDETDELAFMLLNGNSEEASAEIPNLVTLWGDLLEEQYSDIPEIMEKAAIFWKNALTVIVDTYGTGEDEIDKKVEEYVRKIKKYDRSYIVPKSNISVHTSTSPNKAAVEILKIGHPDFRVLPFVPVPVQYIAVGPDAAGGISVELKLNNIKGKTIKYATLYVTAFDQVGSPAACSVHQEATRALSITGPIDAGKDSGKLIFESIWYNPTITSVRMHSMIVEYMDGTKEKYKSEEFGGASAQSAQTGTVTFYGFSSGFPLVSAVSIRINGEEVGTVSRRQTFSWTFEGNARVDLKYKGDFSWRENVLSLTPGITNIQLEYNTKNLISKVW